MAFSYKKKITIDTAKIMGSLTDFPVFISITDTDLKTKARTDGYDIVFKDNTDIKLDHEIVSYDSSTGKLIAWVRMPSLSVSNNIIYMYYGDASAINQENKTGVWNSNYKNVMHFNNNLLDSTSYSNNGSNATATPVAFMDSPVGKAVSFERKNVVQITKNDNWAFEGDELYVSFWMKSRNGTASYDVPFSVEQSGTWQPNFGLFTNSNGNFTFNTGVRTGFSNGTAGSGTLTWSVDGNTDFHHIVLRFTKGVSARFYSDGVNTGTDTTVPYAFAVQDGMNMYLGSSSLAYTSQMWMGDIAEFRFARKDFGDAWVKTEYNNQYSPSTFYSLSAELTAGEGTASNPYPIYDYDDLNRVRNNLSAFYVLAKDIDLSSYAWTPIGDFAGQFDGNGHRINNLTISTAPSPSGFFGKVLTGGVVKNLGLVNATINGGLYTGCLVGWNIGQIRNCFVTGSVSSSGSQVGGIVGFNQGGYIYDSYNLATVTGVGTSRIGGVVGRGGNAVRCYNAGVINVSGYTGGGINGEGTGVVDSYWDTQVSNMTTSVGGGTGLTTLQMKTQSSYSNWDFTSIWGIKGSENNNYPYLRIFVTEPLGQDIINILPIMQLNTNIKIPSVSIILPTPVLTLEKLGNGIRLSWV